MEDNSYRATLMRRTGTTTLSWLRHRTAEHDVSAYVPGAHRLTARLPDYALPCRRPPDGPLSSWLLSSSLDENCTYVNNEVQWSVAGCS